jgi:Phage derived protein Gp49-like (DUF891)
MVMEGRSGDCGRVNFASKARARIRILTASSSSRRKTNPRARRRSIYTKTNIIISVQVGKSLQFRGSTLNELKKFPESAKREAGHQLDQVQRGLEPDNWKPMTNIGTGVREIRIFDESGAF